MKTIKQYILEYTQSDNDCYSIDFDEIESIVKTNKATLNDIIIKCRGKEKAIKCLINKDNEIFETTIIPINKYSGSILVYFNPKLAKKITNNRLNNDERLDFYIELSNELHKTYHKEISINTYCTTDGPYGEGETRVEPNGLMIKIGHVYVFDLIYILLTKFINK